MNTQPLPQVHAMQRMSYMEAIVQAQIEEMERDDRVFLLGEDIGAYGGAFKVTEGFIEKFGEERVIEVLRRNRQHSPQFLLAALIDEVRGFSPREQQDDITLIVAKCRPS